MPKTAYAAELPTPVRAIMTDDPLQIMAFAADAFDRGVGAALVTLVEIRGGAARSLGSQMAVSGEAAFCGFVSGGCTEAAVAAEAAAAIAKGTDRFLLLGEGSTFFDIVLPCGGGITLAIHVLRESSTLRQAAQQLAMRRRVALGYDPGRQRITLLAMGATSQWNNDLFTIAYRPRPRVFLSGRSIELETTATVAAVAGYDVVRHDMDSRRTPDPTLIDADTAVVLLFHEIELEMPTLEAALSRTPFYIGALGSGKTHARRSEHLRHKGYSDADIARIKAPIGIFGKARDARSLALSVLADIASASQG